MFTQIPEVIRLGSVQGAGHGKKQFPALRGGGEDTARFGPSAAGSAMLCSV
jgi:hypothetical protein